MSGCVNSVQMYCGLEMTTMHTRPRESCPHRERVGMFVIPIDEPRRTRRTRRTDTSHSVQDRLGNGSSVLAGVGRAVIHLRAVVAHHRLSAADHVGELALQVDFVSAARESLADALRKSRL